MWSWPLVDFVAATTAADQSKITVLACGAGAHGTFVSYGGWSNITAAPFLSKAGKETSTFTRSSTIAKSRGSANTARDVHGFAIRFYIDEDSLDIVGNNVRSYFPVTYDSPNIEPRASTSVFFIQDSGIPQAATAHNTAWDFFSQQPSALRNLFWAMAGNAIIRCFRHVDRFGVHTLRFIKDDSKNKLVSGLLRTAQA